MSDDLNKKIKQITDILSQDGLPDNLKGILSMLGSSNDSSQSQEKQESAPPENEEKAIKPDNDDSMEMVRKIKKVMDSMRVNNDPRINLLTAIKPFLNLTRQKRINSCVKMLHMASLTKYMDEFDK